MPTRIRGALKDYAWGIPDGLTPWSPDPPAGVPHAELWFGTHPNGPSPVLEGDPYDDAPLLVKILAADQPLSLQLHPAADRAHRDFHAGSPLLADPYEKTEMLVALEPFAVLAGWRDLEQAGAVLARIGLVQAATAVRAGNHADAIRALLALSADAAGGLVPDVVPAFAALGAPGHTLAAYDLIARHYPADPGVFVAVLLDDDVLAPGDAVYMPAGTPHAYLRGLGVEVMTSSDNVLRLGLTPKTVAVEDALAALVDGLESTIVRAPAVDGGRCYDVPGAPFVIDDVDSVVGTEPGDYRLVLALTAGVRVSVGDEVHELAQGEALALAADDPPAQVHGRAVVARNRPSR